MWTTYKAVRNQIKSGDTFFTASPAIFSRLIRFFTKSKVSHTGIFIVIGKRIFALESIEGKGCVAQYASTRFGKEELIVVGRPSFVPDDIIDVAFKDVGVVRYDKTGAVLSLWFDTKSARAFCSEWVVKILSLQKKFSHFNNGITPKDVLTAMKRVLEPHK